jgi:hypothetical protein
MVTKMTYPAAKVIAGLVLATAAAGSHLYYPNLVATLPNTFQEGEIYMT